MKKSICISEGVARVDEDSGTYQDRTRSPGCFVYSGCLEKKLTQRRHYYSVKEERAKDQQPYLDKGRRRRCGLGKQRFEKE